MPITLLRLEKFFFFSFTLLLPTQLGKHFWPSFSYVLGERIDYLSPTVYVTDILLAALLVLFLVNNYQSVKKKIRAVNYKTLLLPLLFFLSLLIGMLLAQNKAEVVYGLIKLFECSFLGFYIFKHKEQKDMLFSLLAVGAVFESVLAAVQFLHQGSLGGPLYFLGERMITQDTPGAATVSLAGHLLLRPYGTFSHPNVLAGYLLIVFSLFLFVWVKKKQTLLISCFILPALFLSLSRTAIVGLFLALVWYVLLRFQHKMVPLIFASLFFLLLLTPLGYRFSDLSLANQSVTERVMLTQNTFAMWKDHFLFGVGLNNFLPALPFYQHPTLLLQPVHNVFLLWTSETGFIGLAFLLYFLFRIAQQIITKKNFFVLPVFFVLIFLGMFDHYLVTLQQGQLFAAFVLGFLFA